MDDVKEVNLTIESKNTNTSLCAIQLHESDRKTRLTCIFQYEMLIMLLLNNN